MGKYNLIELDVWGNDRDGWEVNAAYFTDIVVELSDDVTDRGIIRILKKKGIIEKGIHSSSIGIDGDMDYSLYLDYKGRPILELRHI